MQYFQEALPKDGGQWNQSTFGPAWQPDVPAGWRPYTDGRWAHTDQGWAWVGNEPWAWATYHYGRWYQGENDRWAWIPGNVWAPAWVAWRQGGGYVGWAPLPPSVGYADGGVDLSQAEIPAGAYAFVPARSLLAPRLSAVVLPVEHGSLMLGRTADVTRFASAGGRVVDLGVNVENIERATGRPVRQFRIAALQAGHAGGRPSGNQLAFAQPPALAHAARVSPGEFGRALERQSAARRARFAGTSRAAGERSSRAQSMTERSTGSVGTRSRATSTDARTSDARSRSRRDDGQTTGSSAARHRRLPRPRGRLRAFDRRLRLQPCQRLRVVHRRLRLRPRERLRVVRWRLRLQPRRQRLVVRRQAFRRHVDGERRPCGGAATQEAHVAVRQGQEAAGVVAAAAVGRSPGGSVYGGGKPKCS